MNLPLIASSKRALDIKLQHISQHLASVEMLPGEGHPEAQGWSQNANLQIYSAHWPRLQFVLIHWPLIVIIFQFFSLVWNLLVRIVWNYGPTPFDVSYFNEKMDSSNLMKVISIQLANGRAKNVWKCGTEVGASKIILLLSDHFFPSSDHSFPSDQNFNSSNSSFISLSYLSIYTL